MTDSSTDQKPDSSSIAVKRHAPNLLMIVGGIAVLVFGVSMPDQSADIVEKLVALIGGLLTGGGLLNSARAGVKQDVKQEIKQAVPSGDAVATLNDTVLRMIGGMERIQTDFRDKHEENRKINEEHRKTNEAILAALATDKEESARLHQEHRDAIAELREGHKELSEGQEKLGAQMGEMADKVGQMAQAMGRKN